MIRLIIPLGTAFLFAIITAFACYRAGHGLTKILAIAAAVGGAIAVMGLYGGTFR